MASGVSGKWEASLERALVGGLGKGLGKPRSERPEINPSKGFKGASSSHETHVELPWSLSGGSSELHSAGFLPLELSRGVQAGAQGWGRWGQGQGWDSRGQSCKGITEMSEDHLEGSECPAVGKCGGSDRCEEV